MTNPRILTNPPTGTSDPHIVQSAGQEQSAIANHVDWQNVVVMTAASKSHFLGTPHPCRAELAWTEAPLVVFSATELVKLLD